MFGPTDSTSPSFNRLAGQTSGIVTDDEGRIVCPRCTFHNHPSVLTCEICEASLLPYKHIEGPERTDSPSLLSSAISAGEDAPDSIKFAFRSGGEKIFFERLRDALIQRKWLLQNAPPIPGPAESSSFTADDTSLRPSAAAGKRSVGIAGLERRGLELRKNNELVIGNAFADLSALMTSAKEVIALAESFKQSQLSSESSPESTALINQSASALGLVTTKDMLAPGGAPLYLSELSRHLAELLTDDATAVLRREGGIVSLVDLWALVNRARGGVELVSPQDFLRAAELWEALKLPVRLRRFRSGLLVVQGTDRTDQKTVAALLAWFATLKLQQPEGACSWDWQKYGRGVSVLDTAEKFRWSIGVAVEGLEMAEERGALCREVTLGGIRYWENWLLRDP